MRKDIWKLVVHFPTDEKYKLVDQLVRSTRKCPANIAEGHGRYNWQENIQYCRIARGSLCESHDHLNVANECGYISDLTMNQFQSRIETTIKMINGYIKYLNKRKSSTS